MKITKVTLFSCLVALLMGLAGTVVLAEQQTSSLQAGAEAETMPVMTGEQWQTLLPESKIAFIWGVGHVVTIEEHVVARHPELKRNDFVAKLAEGLKGIPMNTIVQTVDNYYQANPGNLDLPVMRVVWRQIVKPKIKSGIADAPMKDQD